MQTIDPKQEQRVWSRVLQTDPQAGQEPLPRPTTLAEELRVGFETEQKSCAEYRAMAACACGCTKRTLLALAQEAACDARTFGALYYLSANVRLCRQTAACEPVCDLCAAIKARCQTEADAAEAYQKTAERMQTTGGRVAAIAKRKMCAAERLLRLLERCV